MSKHAKQRMGWIGIALALIAIVIGSQYVRAAIRHHGSNGTAAATPTISPPEITRNAGVLPVTTIELYF